MPPASGQSTRASVPAATVPLACSCDQLQRAQQRLQALTSQCSEVFNRLQQAFDRLPAAAAFDPFAVAAPAPVAGGQMAGAPASRRGAEARPPTETQRLSARPAGPPGQIGSAGQRLQQVRPLQAAPTTGGGLATTGALAAAVAGRSGASSGGGDRGPAGLGVASLDDWLGSLGTLSTLGGEQVARLMQRHAAPSLTAGLGAALAGALAVGGDADQPPAAQRRREGVGLPSGPLGAALAQVLQAAAPTGPPGRVERPSTVLGQGLGEALATTWPGPPAAPARPVGMASQALATAPQLLEQLLSQGLGGAVAGTSGRAVRPADLPRRPAPRAASRLVGAQPPAAQDQARAQGPDAPAAAALEALDAGEAMAQQISRLLLDQAWMRGVDLR